MASGAPSGRRAADLRLCPSGRERAGYAWSWLWESNPRARPRGPRGSHCNQPKRKRPRGLIPGGRKSSMFRGYVNPLRLSTRSIQHSDHDLARSFGHVVGRVIQKRLQRLFPTEPFASRVTPRKSRVKLSLMRPSGPVQHEDQLEIERTSCLQRIDPVADLAGVENGPNLDQVGADGRQKVHRRNTICRSANDRSLPCRDWLRALPLDHVVLRALVCFFEHTTLRYFRFHGCIGGIASDSSWSAKVRSCRSQRRSRSAPHQSR